MATAAVPPAELEMVSTRSVREKGLFDGGPVKIVLVVSGCRHDKKAVGKAGAAFKCETNVSRSAATPVDFCLSIPQYKLIAWWSFGNASRCEAAELP